MTSFFLRKRRNARTERQTHLRYKDFAIMRLGARRAVVRRCAPLCAGTAVLLLLACVHARTAGSMVEILEPVDGDKSLPHSFAFHYRAHTAGRVACFIDGRSIYTSDEPEQRLNIPYLPLGFHTLELQLTGVGGAAAGSAGGEVLGYDVVEVFVLGDGELAPEGLDDDEHVKQKENEGELAAAIEAALERASVAAAGSHGSGALAEFAAAEAELKRIVSVLANVPGSLVPRCYYSLAQVLLARGDSAGVERAIAALREAVWHSPAHGESHHLLGAQFSKVLSLEILYSKYTTALTYENVCQRPYWRTWRKRHGREQRPVHSAETRHSSCEHTRRQPGGSYSTRLPLRRPLALPRQVTPSLGGRPAQLCVSKRHRHPSICIFACARTCTRRRPGQREGECAAVPDDGAMQSERCNHSAGSPPPRSPPRIPPPAWHASQCGLFRRRGGGRQGRGSCQGGGAWKGGGGNTTAVESGAANGGVGAI